LCTLIGRASSSPQSNDAALTDPIPRKMSPTKAIKYLIVDLPSDKSNLQLIVEYVVQKSMKQGIKNIKKSFILSNYLKYSSFIALLVCYISPVFGQYNPYAETMSG